MAIAIRRRRDSTANWTANNPILEDGQLGFELTASGEYDKFKIGDGKTRWNDLKYSFDYQAVKAQADIIIGNIGTSTTKAAEAMSSAQNAAASAQSAATSANVAGQAAAEAAEEAATEATELAVADIQEQFNAVIRNVTVDSEVILARGAEATLANRLSKSEEQINDVVAEEIIRVQAEIEREELADTIRVWIENPEQFKGDRGEASGSPKGTFANFALLQADSVANTEDGKKNIYVVAENGNWYYWNGTTWTSGGIYQAFASASITPEKTTFFKMGKNLFNKNTRTLTVRVNQTNGNLEVNANYDASDFIEIEPLINYWTTYDYRTAWYDNNKDYIGGQTDATNAAKVITFPANAKYVRFTIAKNKVDNFQLEKGTTFTGYEEYTLYFDSSLLKERYLTEFDFSIGYDQLDDGLKRSFIETKNLLNPKAINVDRTLTAEGNLYTSAGSYTSDYIEVNEGEAITYSVNSIKKTMRYLAEYDINKTCIQRLGIYVSNYVVPTGVKFIRVSDTADWVNSQVQIEIGTDATPFEHYGYKVVTDTESTTQQPVLEQYILDEIKEVVDKVVAKESNLTFAFATDIHDNQYHYGKYEYKFKILAELGKYGVLNFMAIGGDVVDGGETTPNMKKRLIGRLLDAKNSFPTDLFICQGNHDTGWDDFPTNTIKPYEWHNMACNHLEGKVMFDSNNQYGGYYYKDYDRSKIRVIVLNTSDYYELDIDGNPTLNPMNVYIRQAQIDWLQNKALKFTDKGNDRSNWGVVILSHAPIPKNEYGGLYAKTAIHEILKAYMNGSSYSGTIANGSAGNLIVNCDFTEQGQMELICSINGHLHWDRVTTYPDLNRPCITVPNFKTGVDYKVEPLPTGAVVNTDRTVGTINAELFDIFSINRAERKIYTTRFGAGNDRVIDY